MSIDQKIRRLILCVGCCLFPLTIATGQLKVSTDFEGGSAEVVAVDEEAGFIHVTPRLKADHGWPCWWSCRIDGLKTGQKLKFKVSAHPKAYRNKTILSHIWTLPDRSAFSWNNRDWSQTAECEREAKSATYEIDVVGESVWIAWGPPFVPSDAGKLLEEAKSGLPEATIFELAKTRDGKSVQGIRFGADPNDQDQLTYGVWVQARQHAWEAGSSWVARGFLKWAISDDPAAVRLRSKAHVVVVPIMDVDNVTNGAGGKDAVPRDHNRDWDDNPVYPEVEAAQREILRLSKRGVIDVFLDLHNPGPGSKKPFFYGPRIDDLTGIRKRNYVRWIAFANAHIDPLESAYQYTSYIKTQEERNRTSGGWVRNHTAPHVIATTLETVWNTPRGTQSGNEKVGRELGMTLERYLSENPRDVDSN